jgi:phenylacetate-coenzyme A ligase PaaK-like adenylate-forming protein
MPALTKADLREHQPAKFVPEGRDLASALARGEVELVKTSGSTSDAVTNVWCQEWWDACEASSWKLHAATASARLGDHREAILSSPRCVGFASEVEYLSMEQRTLKPYLFLTEKADPAEWSAAFCDRMIEELGQFEPAVLEANPSFLSVLCRHAIKRDREVYQPAVVTLTYENPSLVHLRHIRSIFKCPTISSYGATESGYVFMQCEVGRLHQNVEQCHVDFEPLTSRHGGPMIGRILVTTFHNPWRYALHAPSFENGDERFREQRVPIVDQVLCSSQKSIHGICQIAGHLLHPLLAWVNSNPHDLDVAALEFDDEKHHVPNRAECAQGFHAEEIAGA